LFNVPEENLSFPIALGRGIAKIGGDQGLGVATMDQDKEGILSTATAAVVGTGAAVVDTGRRASKAPKILQ
jgi:hypothetical protein